MHRLTAEGLHDLEGRLSQRDWLVVKYLAELHFISGGQLARLCFWGGAAPDTRAARRALLRLTRLGVLDRLPRSVGGVRSGSAGFVYHLDLAGQSLAIQRGWQPERRRRRSNTPGTLFLNHTLLVAELHVLLVEADRSQSIELLELSSEPACWRSFRRTQGQRQILKPDSYARLGVGDFEDSYFFEIDNGTEGSRTIVRQLSSYVAYYASGEEQQRTGVFPKSLWLTSRAERVAVIEDCVASLPLEAHALFQVAPFEAVLDVIAAPENGQNP